MKKKKQKSLSKLKKEADAIYSKYIRQKYSKNGLVMCVSCGSWKPIKEMQNGHYVSRSYLSTRFYNKNCHPQCYACNICRSGNMDEYSLWLIGTYGEGILEELNRKKWEQVKYTKEDYLKMIERYKKKIKILKEIIF